MEERKFKTSAKCSGCVNAIAAEMDKIVKREDWSIDLSSPDSVMTLKSDVADADVINAVKSAGYEVEKI